MVSVVPSHQRGSVVHIVLVDSRCATRPADPQPRSRVNCLQYESIMQKKTPPLRRGESMRPHDTTLGCALQSKNIAQRTRTTELYGPVDACYTPFLVWVWFGYNFTPFVSPFFFLCALFLFCLSSIPIPSNLGAFML